MVTYSPLFRTTRMAFNENPNTWGDVANSQVFNLIEDAIGGLATFSLTSGDVTLTTNNGASDQARNMIIKMTGVPTANRTVTIPSTTKLYIVHCTFSTSFTATVKTASGTGVAFSSGETGVIYCDGTDVIEIYRTPSLYTEPVGTIKPYIGTTAPSGYLLTDNKTIGNASSGATARADADTETLFTLIWNSIANTQAPIQDSAGTPTTRGASAAADFAANKRIPLPDIRGRSIFGKDDMGGTAASRITNAGCSIVGTTNGITGGSQNHTMTSAQLVPHTHTASFTRAPDGATGSTAAILFDNIYQNTSTNTTAITIASAGGGQPFPIMPPTYITNFIIKY